MTVLPGNRVRKVAFFIQKIFESNNDSIGVLNYSYALHIDGSTAYSFCPVCFSVSVFVCKKL